MKSRNKILYSLLFLVSLAVVIIAVVNIVPILAQQGQRENMEDQLQMDMIKDADENSMVPISIDFDALLAAHKDTVGWLYCEGTSINYPVMQAEDNDYYLSRLPDGRKNRAGSLFLDYRSDQKFADMNSIIYGHNMKDGSMFGSLGEYSDQEYYEAHPEWYMFTPDTDYKILLLSAHITDIGSDDYAMPFLQSELDEMVARSVSISDFNSFYAYESGRKVITLSTCAYTHEDARYVLLGMLMPL